MRHFPLILAAAGLVLPVAATVPADQAQARKHRYYSSDSRVDCRRAKGTTGTIAGGAGGAVVAGALGASPLGVVASGVGGALLGRHIDKHRDAAQNRRNGC